MSFTASAFAAENPTTLTGFEAAFRHAVDTRDVGQLDRLTCWDGVSPQQRERWHDIYFTTCFYQIDRFRILPAVKASSILHSLGPLSLTPLYVFEVHYHLRPLPGAPMRVFFTHYPVGRKDGRFYFAVAFTAP